MDRNKTISKLVQASSMLAAVGEELSFTKAAERLSVDQSSTVVYSVPTIPRIPEL
jgi:LysR family glycine cleavage system transcriptional activator